MICDVIASSAQPFMACHKTPNGARVETTCLFPSFDPVSVYVIQHGDGFIVHDGGGAVHSALQHGRAVETVVAALQQQANRYGLQVKDGHLQCQCESSDWLPSAIMSVANGAAAAAQAALDGQPEDGEEVSDLKSAIKESLYERFSSHMASGISRVGRSGKKFKFDFAVSQGGRTILINAISPSPMSIAFRYTAFQQVGARSQGGAIASFDRALNGDDQLMIQEVADLVPVGALAEFVEKELHVGA